MSKTTTPTPIGADALLREMVERQPFEAWWKLDTAYLGNWAKEIAWTAWQARAALASAAQPAAVSVAAEPFDFPHQQMDAVALARYKVAPSHDSMFHRFAVVAGDGAQQLYLGRETECRNMARKFAGAFLDGAFYHSRLAAAPKAAPALPAQQPGVAYAELPEPVAYRHLHEDGWEYYDAPTGGDCPGCQPLYSADQQSASRGQPPAPAPVAGPSDEELLAVSHACHRMPGGHGMHYRNYAHAVLARWGAAPTTQAAPQPAKWAKDLHTFLNAAAGEGFVLDGVDAAELYIAAFPRTFYRAIGDIDALAAMHPAPAAQGDARLWCVHVQGPDDVHAMPTKAEALERANELNKCFGRHPYEEGDPIMRAVVIEWPHAADLHATALYKRAMADAARAAKEGPTP